MSVFSDAASTKASNKKLSSEATERLLIAQAKAKGRLWAKIADCIKSGFCCVTIFSVVFVLANAAVRMVEANPNVETVDAVTRLIHAFFLDKVLYAVSLCVMGGVAWSYRDSAVTAKLRLKERTQQLEDLKTALENVKLIKQEK